MSALVYLDVCCFKRPFDDAAQDRVRREAEAVAGWKALTERLGPAGAMRFMMQYDPGRGDYSQERHDLFADLTLDELLDSIHRKESGEESGDDRT